MALREITAADLQGKGVTFLPDVPGLPAEQMQAKFEEVVREVVIVIFNENVQKTYDMEQVDAAIVSEAGRISGEIIDKAMREQIMPAVTEAVAQIGNEILAEAKRLVDKAVQDGIVQMNILLAQGFAEINTVLEQGMLVEDPTTGTKQPVGVVFANMAAWINSLHDFEPIVPEEFEAMNIDPAEFEAMDIDPLMFEQNGKNILVGG